MCLDERYKSVKSVDLIAELPAERRFVVRGNNAKCVQRQIALLEVHIHLVYIEAVGLFWRLDLRLLKCYNFCFILERLVGLKVHFQACDRQITLNAGYDIAFCAVSVGEIRLAEVNMLSEIGRASCRER